jgi:prepilin-type N-terminal cleavage/methylation domain-containing protein
MLSKASETASRSGLTLIELLVATAIMSMLAAASVGMINAGLRSHQEGLATIQLHNEAMETMERITDSIRRATWVMAPNSHTPRRELLIVSGFTNDDNDFYFGDPLFPRIDEDPKDDMNNDDKSGVGGFDDDGNGSIDERGNYDDDEDGADDEDPLDGLDNDGDGNIDEDMGNDSNEDGKPGIQGIDDDGDGSVDEGENDDDDEDGTTDEDPLNARVFWIPSGTSLREDDPGAGLKRVLSDHASFFRVTCVTAQLFRVELTLTDAEGRQVALDEHACARNVFQPSGKRVR